MIVLVAIVLVVLAMAVVGGEHGPLRHMPAGSGPRNSPIAAVGV
jgi:hypothetical protein